MQIIRMLVLFFSVIAVMFIAFVIYSLTAVINLNSLHQYERDYSSKRIEYLLESHQQFTEMRRVLRISFYNPQFVADQDVVLWFRYQTAVTEVYNNLITLLNRYREVVYNDTRITTEEQNLRIEKMDDIVSSVMTIYNIFYDNFFFGGNDSFNNHSASQYNDGIEINFNNLRELELELRENTINDIDRERTTVQNIILWAGISILILMMFIAIFVISTFAGIIKHHKVTMKRIVMGEFTGIDEEGNSHEFNQMTMDIANNFKTIKSSVDRISKEISLGEEIVPIDQEEFKGIYAEIAKSINELLVIISDEKQTNEFKQIVMDTMPMVCTIWSKELKVVDSNDRVIRLYGYRSKQEYYENVDRVSPERQPDGRRSSEKAIELVGEAFSKGYLQFEWMHQDLEGNLIPSDVILFRSVYRGENVVIAFARDLRELKKSMEEERKATEHIKFMLDNSPMIINYWNTDLKSVYANENRAELQDFEHLTKNQIELLLPETQPDGTNSVELWQSIIQHTFDGSSGNDEKWEIVYIADKQEVYLEIEACKGMYKDEEIVITYAKDITELRRAIQDTDMERERVAIAKENSLAKSMFLAKMSHEIRTPISAVLGISEIQIMNAKHDIETEEAFVKIHSSANILLDIVNDILDISKIESGKMPLIKNPYDVASFIGDTAHINTVYLGSKKIDFRVKVDPHLPETLIGDELRIKQIVNNILSNSFKYTERGYVYLEIGFEEVSEEEVSLNIIIEDTGKGMTEGQLESLFEDYARFDEEEDFIQGTGLGMPIVKSFVDLMEGKIFVTSKVKVGTKVVVSLPQKVINGANIIGESTAANLEDFRLNTLKAVEKLSLTPDPMPHAKVLVVDDIEANLYVAKGLMSRYQITVETCSSGYDAIMKVKDGNVYDIIFMDQMMPQISGIKTTQVIRDLGYEKPIVAFTANALVGKSEEYIKNGFDGFISKPIQVSYLDSILKKFIKPMEEGAYVNLSDEEILEKIEKELDDDFLAEDFLEEEQEDDYAYLKDPEIIKEIHKDFKENQTKAYEEIIEALEKEELDVARVKAHSIKTFASMMYEKILRDISEEMESLLDQGVKPSSTLLEEFRVELLEVLKSME